MPYEVLWSQLTWPGLFFLNQYNKTCLENFIKYSQSLEI